jgi:hypothetical protein
MELQEAESYPRAAVVAAAVVATTVVGIAAIATITVTGAVF